MHITRRTDYAVRMMLELARAGGRVSSKRLGGLADVTYPFARSIVTDLAAAGLVDARRGPGGGVALARPAGEITLLDIVEAMEGRVALNLCATDPGYCERSAECSAHDIWSEAGAVLSAYLALQDLESLANRPVLSTSVR